MGPLKKIPHVRGGSGGGGGVGELDLMNVSMILALGGSICRILRGSEARRGPGSYGLKGGGGPAKEGPHARGGSELGSYEDLMNVLRILVLGGWICCVLRGSAALGGFSF